MKSLVLGFSTLLAISGTPVLGHAQEQIPYSDNSGAAVLESAGPDWNQDGAYAPDPTQEGAMPQPAASFGYFGPHPIPYDQGDGFCQHGGAHEHVYPVFDRNLFRVVDGYAYFVGDPADFGYASQAYVYRADHPIDAVYGGGFCYMHWQHRHLFAPSAVGFAWDGGAYAYTGVFAPSYYSMRPFYVNYFDHYYRPYYLRGAYSYRRPAPVYPGWGWHRPIYNRPYGAAWGRSPAYVHPWGRPGYMAPPAYRAPAYRSPAPVYRGPAYHPSGPVYRGPMVHAPAFRTGAPAWHAAAPAWRGGHFRR